ncbi:helix-turn-helix domain-containing protein [Natrinema salsiterrestre]|uniref:Helix-turn-helix domain-containing protein n=1 Tax=Natrinema salsiterrestre TaxID=2950540 RepID=A0A9Q4Q443_9EURY|nr:helix-turn-helix domain-containing protein [Natrinema salsiterrestre]MDF9746912.1 helix-turn-helix domain-containing protein [Natrinema salsiterrestre]
MKRLRVTVRVDPDRAPPFFDLLANTPAIEEARVLEVNTTLDGVDNYLFSIDGDATVLAERAPEIEGLESVRLSESSRGRTYALVVARSLEMPMYDSILRASSRLELIVRTPIIYRDGEMYGSGVGDPQQIQAALEETSDVMEIRVDEIGEFRGELDDPVRALSDRQREALSVAFEMGYYERPRRATHEDIAAELDCAPATASGHLQKAEAKLVRAAMDDFGPTL